MLELLGDKLDKLFGSKLFEYLTKYIGRFAILFIAFVIFMSLMTVLVLEFILWTPYSIFFLPSTRSKETWNDWVNGDGDAHVGHTFIRYVKATHEIITWIW